jgi:hypothetical protein
MSIRNAWAFIALAVLAAWFATAALAGPIGIFAGALLAGPLAGGLAGLLGGSLLATIAANAIVSIGFGVLSRALAPKPKPPTPLERMVNFAQPVSFMERGYGRVRKGGPICFTAFKHNTRYYGVLIASHRTKGPVEHWLDKTPVEVDASGNVTTAPFAGAARIIVKRGIGGQDANFVWVNNFPDEVTAAHDFKGLSYAGINAERVPDEDFSNVYPNGRQWDYVPVWDMHDRIFDPRDGIEKWTDNAALIIAHEVIFSGREVDWAEVAAEANICDELIVDAEGNAHKRWTINGVFDDQMEWEQVRDALALACDAFFYERSDGKLGFKVGHWIEPTLTLSDRDFLAISISDTAWGPDVAGEFTVRYVEPARDWSEAVSGAWIEEAGGKRDEREAFLINSHNQATRIAKRLARVARARFSIQARVKLIGYEIIGQRFVRIQHAEMGIDAVAEIGRITRAADGLSFEVEASTVAADDFAFNAAIEEPARPSFAAVLSEDAVTPPASLTGTVVADTGGAAVIEWSWPRQDASQRAELRTRVIENSQLSAQAAASFAPSANIPDTDMNAVAPRNRDATLQASVILPATPSDGILFERGGVGQSMWIGLRDGGAALRYRVGMGKAASATDTEVIVIDLPTTSLPFDGATHDIEWEIALAAPARARLWIDGVLRASQEIGGGGGMWGWSGLGAGAFGHLAVSDVTGEPGTGWPVTVTQSLNVWPALRDDLASSDWQSVIMGSGQTSFLATGLIDGASYQAQVRNRTGANRVSDWAPPQPITVQALANTTPPGPLTGLAVNAQSGNAVITFTAPNDPAYFAARIYRAAGTAGFATAVLLRTEFGLPGSTDTWTDVAPGSGDFRYWAEPINASGVAGPRSGPVTVSII